MTEIAVTCHTLSKSFGPVRAVESVSFRLERGQFLALLGPSGCGKTTVLRMIAGLERPDSGAIELAGRIVSDDRTFTPPDRRRVGLVFQDYALFPHLTWLFSMPPAAWSMLPLKIRASPGSTSQVRMSKLSLYWAMSGTGGPPLPASLT